MHKLEELFNIAARPRIGDTPEESADAKVEAENLITSQQEVIVAVDSAIDKIDAALPTVKDLEASDSEMDELATLAKDGYTSMMDLAMNVEPRFSGPILQSASTLLGHAITAKMAKMDKKLKMVDLQIKKAKLDQATDKGTPVGTIKGEGTVLDRNELLRTILQQQNDK